MIDKLITAAIEREASSGPAFGTYTDTEQEKHYAFFINGQGQLLLLSKAYSAERYAEHTVQRFQEGKCSFSVCEVEKGWYLEAKSEGGKLIGNSPFFATEAEAIQAIQEIEQGETAPGTTEKPAEQRPAKAPLIPPSAEAGGQPPRYSFRLDFYKAEKGAPVRGRIEYSLTQESAAFHGLDMEFVRSFVARQLHETETSRAPDMTGQIRILENGVPVSPSVLASNLPLEVELALEVPEQDTYDAFVYAKSLESQQQALVGRKRGRGGPIRLSIFTDSLPASLYRLTATVHFKQSDINYSLSSTLFHLLADSKVEEGLSVEG